ncbi:MAG: NAD(P)-dependent oxidoreductase [Bacillota bacterium]|nr:NAD(P)-dependent oxidoreductase [Bacillota bacterium]
MNKILITGGSGFIGSHLAKGLSKKGFEVSVYDIKPNNNNEIEYINGDILNYRRLKAAIKGKKIVCHLAAMVGVEACLKDEEKVCRTNIEGTQNVIRACAESGVENLLFTSSSEVYGEGSPFIVLDEGAKLNPISRYGESKLHGEWLMKQFSENSNVKVTVLRYCNIYGKRQRKEFVVSIFINNVLENKPLRICGDGEQLRSFTYIDDAVEGTIKALLRYETQFDVFNIGSSYNIKIKDLAKKIIELNKSGKIEYVTYEELNRKKDCEILYRIPSIEKARNCLGYSDATDLDKGLQTIFDYYKSLKEDLPVASLT